LAGFGVTTEAKNAAMPRPKRKWRTKLERRKIVEETLIPGASVIKVAGVHGVRPNQVHHWRRLYRQGLLGSPTTTALVPVRITDTAERGAAAMASGRAFAQSHSPAQRSAPGVIQIETDKARVSMHGAADQSCVRLVLEYLLG
jgi:transposase-like protein